MRLTCRSSVRNIVCRYINAEIEWTCVRIRWVNIVEYFSHGKTAHLKDIVTCHLNNSKELILTGCF